MKVSRVLAVVLGAALGLLPIVPPEHVHEAEDHGHVHAVMHRHLTPHGISGHHEADHFTALDDDDAPVLTLKTIYNVPAPQVVVGPSRIPGEWLEPPTPRQVERPLADVEILIHGPPRAPTSLRAPPFVPAT